MAQEAFPKTILEFFQDPPLDQNGPLIRYAADWIQRSGGGVIDYAVVAQHLMRAFSIPDTVETPQLLRPIYFTALAKNLGVERWWLDFEAVTACLQTRLPADLLDGRLPRLPSPVMLVVIPASMAIQLNVLRGDPSIPTVPASQFCLVEEAPGMKWSCAAFNTTTDSKRLMVSTGWLDASNGPILRQLEDVYDTNGSGAMWRLLANLFLVHEHRHLVERAVRPHVPLDKVKRRKMLQRCSPAPYKVIDLTEGSRIVPSEHRSALEQDDRAAPRFHWVSGHWRGYWRLDPDPSRPTLQVQSRDAEGKPPLFKQATWVLPFARGLGGGAAPREARVTARPGRPLAIPKSK